MVDVKDDNERLDAMAEEIADAVTWRDFQDRDDIHTHGLLLDLVVEEQIIRGAMAKRLLSFLVQFDIDLITEELKKDLIKLTPHTDEDIYAGLTLSAQIHLMKVGGPFEALCGREFKVWLARYADGSNENKQRFTTLENRYLRFYKMVVSAYQEFSDLNLSGIEDEDSSPNDAAQMLLGVLYHIDREFDATPVFDEPVRSLYILRRFEEVIGHLTGLRGDDMEDNEKFEREAMEYVGAWKVAHVKLQEFYSTELPPFDMKVYIRKLSRGTASQKWMARCIQKEVARVAGS
jgi:hypothetical protein